MKVSTARFGVIEVAESEIIIFPKGIPGLPENKKFIILPASNEDQSPFFFLQSIEEEALSLFMIDPFQMFADYDISLDQKTIDSLKIDKEEDVIIFTMITVNNSLSDSTTNLKAPLVINTKEKLGMQMIIENSDYQIKQPLSV